MYERHTPRHTTNHRGHESSTKRGDIPLPQLMSLTSHALDIHCVSKQTSPMFLAITRESIVGFSYFAEILLRKQAIKRSYIFPPHLINASALPCKTENTENVSFHVNVSC